VNGIFPSAVIKEKRSAICLTCIAVWVCILFFSSTIRWATVQTVYGLIIETERWKTSPKVFFPVLLKIPAVWCTLTHFYRKKNVVQKKRSYVWQGWFSREIISFLPLIWDGIWINCSQSAVMLSGPSPNEHAFQFSQPFL